MVIDETPQALHFDCGQSFVEASPAIEYRIYDIPAPDVNVPDAETGPAITLADKNRKQTLISHVLFSLIFGAPAEWY